MDNDMIGGMETVEQMRERVKSQVRAEKEKTIRETYTKQVDAITTGCCKNYLDTIVSRAGSPNLLDFEVRYFDKAKDDLIQLVKLCYFTKHQAMTSMELMKESFDFLVHGGPCIDGYSTDELIEYLKTYETKILTQSLKVYLNNIITRV